MVAMLPPLPGSTPGGEGRATNRVVLLLLNGAVAAWVLLAVGHAPQCLYKNAPAGPASVASSGGAAPHYSGSSVDAAPDAAAAKVLVGWAHDPRALGPRPASGLTPREAQGLASDNSGNLVWSLAARRLLDPAATELVAIEAPYNRSVRAVLFPEANLLVNSTKYPKTFMQYTQLLLRMVRGMPAPIMLIGIGSQVRYEEAPLAAAGQPETFASAALVTLHEEQRALLRRVVASGGFVTTRGHFTEGIIKANELPPPLVLGCPSLFLNHNPRLGELMQQKWDAVLAKRDPGLRLAITLPNFPGDKPYPIRLLTLLAERLLKAYPNSTVVLQTPRDENTLAILNQRSGVYLRSHRVRYYYDAQSWVDGLRGSFDFAFGWRIHGQMAALAAEVPGLLVAPDWRVKELADTMQLPTVDMSDLSTMDTPAGRLDPDAFDLFDFVEAAAPHGYRGFDANRQRIAAVYAGEFERLGVPLHPGVLDIAQGVQQ